LLPRKMDLWIARHWPGIYYVLWTYGQVRNEPPDSQEGPLK
jgi:hypothetical protein